LIPPKRLSLQRCRTILGPTCTLSDSALEQYRDSLYALADIAIESYPKLQTPKATSSLGRQKRISFESMLNLLSEAEREEAIERISIMEVESGLPREEAEKLILAKYFKPNKRN
jgi:hypothetical protein